jgi:hypothetical protein
MEFKWEAAIGKLIYWKQEILQLFNKGTRVKGAGGDLSFTSVTLVWLTF